jgi:hypothetical protein
MWPWPAGWGSPKPLSAASWDHASRLDGVVAALSVLGRGLIIEDQKQVAA